MMESRKILDILILIIMIAAFLTAAVSSAWQPGKEKEVIENHTLAENQVSGIKNVNIDMESNGAGYFIGFSNNTSSVYDIQTVRSPDSPKPRINYTRNGDTLNIKMKMENGSARIILSNKYLYNVSMKSKVGGFALLLSNNSKIDTLNSNIQYAGGGSLVLGNTTFNQINLNVNSGGFYIMGAEPQLNGSINATVNIGGITLDVSSLRNQSIKIVSGVDMGGITFKPEGFKILKNTTNFVEIQTLSYEGSKTRLDIRCNVGVGGVSINIFSMPYPPVRNV